MNRGIYATATGMIASQYALDVISQNLANASTTGYKREAVAFNDALVRELRGNGGRGPVLGSLGGGPSLQSRFTVFEPGPIQETGNDLDIAIRSSEGAFAVETDRGMRFTRDGAFTRNADGLLVTRSGHPVLDSDNQRIQLPEGPVEIGNDGLITSDGKEIARLGVFQGTFQREGDSLFTAPAAQAIATPDLNPKSIEGSNVNTIQSMVAMIEVSRSFEMAQRSIIQQDELTQRLIQSLQSQ
ncbi:MAG TPA: flagellar hook-basal body protein [Fimbriimonadaceae bacterium]|nr:flagellar hook-basal body protein [Fimbriimonadaceae bacterium]HRJ96237.1 flagellar hook-basal body protein [Fimbriimonadaceae bacterium]